jgi:hypothetical protein
MDSRPESATTEIDEYPDISGITNAREAMKKLPEEDKAKIEQQVPISFKILYIFSETHRKIRT